MDARGTSHRRHNCHCCESFRLEIELRKIEFKFSLLVAWCTIRLLILQNFKDVFLNNNFFCDLCSVVVDSDSAYFFFQILQYIIIMKTETRCNVKTCIIRFALLMHAC